MNDAEGLDFWVIEKSNTYGYVLFYRKIVFCLNVGNQVFPTYKSFRGFHVLQIIKLVGLVIQNLEIESFLAAYPNLFFLTRNFGFNKSVIHSKPKKRNLGMTNLWDFVHSWGIQGACYLQSSNVFGFVN